MNVAKIAKEILADKAFHTLMHQGYKIQVYKVHSQFGDLYWADNDIGEPYLEDHKLYKDITTPIEIEKKNIDNYLREVGAKE